MEAFRFDSSRSLRRVEAPDLGHTGTFGIIGAVGVLLPLRSALIVSGEPAGLILLDTSSAPREVGVPGVSDVWLGMILDLLQVRLASRATRWQTPSGGVLPGTALKGVTVGSRRYNKYVDQRCLSISGDQSTRFFFGTCFWTTMGSPSAVAGVSLPTAFLDEARLNGFGASLSGLVQLPPCDASEAELSLDESEESDEIEKADIGRLILSPMFC